MFLCLFIELEGIILKCFYKEIKCSVRLYTLISIGGEVVVKKVTVLALDLNVDLRVRAT